MILFLTSSPCDDNVPEGVQLPCILFERNQFVENLRKYWKEDSKVVIVSAFPDNYPADDEMRETFEGCFNYHELTCTMEVIDHRNDDQAEDLISESDMLIFGGGHVPTEMAYFEELGLRDLVKDYPGIMMGISAGSMNTAEMVYSQPEEPGEATDPDYVRYFPGLGLTKINMLPHYQKVKDNILDGMRLYEDITFTDSIGHKFYSLPDGSYILETDDRITIYGESYLITEGQIHKLCEDEEIIVL